MVFRRDFVRGHSFCVQQREVERKTENERKGAKNKQKKDHQKTTKNRPCKKNRKTMRNMVVSRINMNPDRAGDRYTNIGNRDRELKEERRENREIILYCYSFCFLGREISSCRTDFGLGRINSEIILRPSGSDLGTD